MNDYLNGIAKLLALIVTIILILGYPMMLLWNWLMPELFGLPTITFLQAIGLNILTSIIFRPNVTIKK